MIACLFPFTFWWDPELLHRGDSRACGLWPAHAGCPGALRRTRLPERL